MRRVALFLVFLCLLITATPRWSCAQAAANNILLLILDDVGVEAVPFYPLRPGIVRTNPPPPPMPNLAALAGKGVIFTSVWANPLCAPSRATIFTGRYGFRTGMGNNPNSSGVPELARSEVILPEPFVARPGLGYVLGAVGKWHVSDGLSDPNLYGWPYYAGILPGRAGLELYNSWRKDVNGTVTRSKVYATTDQINEAIKLINTAAGKHYFVQVAFNAPHNPYHVPPLDLHSRDSLPPFKKGMASRPYFEAAVEALDTEIGRLLRNVNLADTTVIVMGDNGTAQGNLVPPFISTRGKGTLYEPGIRVPLVIAGAGVTAPGRTVNGVVNSVDIFPTVLELAGIPVPTDTKLDGISLGAYLRNGSGPKRQWAYSEFFSSAKSYTRAIRNGRYKLIKAASGFRQLFDLTADPLEARNLLNGSLTATQRTNLNQLNTQLNALLASR